MKQIRDPVLDALSGGPRLVKEKTSNAIRMPTSFETLRLGLPSFLAFSAPISVAVPS